MGHWFSSRPNIPETVTPYSLRSSVSSASRMTFEWGYSGSKQHVLNFLGKKFQNVGTTEQFIDTFIKQMKPEDIMNIHDLFDSIKSTLPQTVEALHFYTAINCRFSDVFFHEFVRCKHLFGESSEVSVGTFMEKHCNSAIITHCLIVQHLDSMVYVDHILNAIASSHVFLSRLSLSIKKHDEILYKFLKQEFLQYKPKATFVSLRKYFKIISARTQALIEQKVEKKCMYDVIEGMKFLKNLYELYKSTNPCESFNELFRCHSADRISQSIAVPSRTLKSSPSIETSSSGSASM